jgi:hypothetical protein
MTQSFPKHPARTHLIQEWFSDNIAEPLLDFKNQPGIELFLQGATPQLSSPQLRFTPEFEMGSEWVHNAIDTRKLGEFLITGTLKAA